MANAHEAGFQAKQQLVALFKAQVAELRPVLGEATAAINTAAYDDLLAQGASARWPAGKLAGLRQGVRDLQFMLELQLTPPQRVLLRQRLAAAAGGAVEFFEAQDARRLAVIEKRGRVRTEDEYHLVRAAIDRLAAASKPDQVRLRRLQGLADAASVA